MVQKILISSSFLKLLVVYHFDIISEQCVFLQYL